MKLTSQIKTITCNNDYYCQLKWHLYASLKDICLPSKIIAIHFCFLYTMWTRDVNLLSMWMPGKNGHMALVSSYVHVNFSKMCNSNYQLEQPSRFPYIHVWLHCREPIVRIICDPESTCLVPYQIMLRVLYYLLMKLKSLQCGFLYPVSCTDGAYRVFYCSMPYHSCMHYDMQQISKSATTQAK